MQIPCKVILWKTSQHFRLINRRKKSFSSLQDRSLYKSLKRTISTTSVAIISKRTNRERSLQTKVISQIIDSLSKVRIKIIKYSLRITKYLNNSMSNLKLKKYGSWIAVTMKHCQGRVWISRLQAVKISKCFSMASSHLSWNALTSPKIRWKPLQTQPIPTFQ